jgi:hypothetical protein
MLENGAAVLYEGQRSRFAYEAREKQLFPLLLLIASETLPIRATSTINAAIPPVSPTGVPTLTRPIPIAHFSQQP